MTTKILGGKVLANIIKYHNDINTIKFTGFNEKEIDVLFTLILKAKETNEKEIMITFSEFNELIEEQHNKARLKQYIISTSKKLKKITQLVELPNGKIRIFSLFDLIEIDPNEKIITFIVNEDFKYSLNNLVGNFTMFEFKEFIRLKGCYAKNLFRLLKQFESTKLLSITLDSFRDILGVPKSYRMVDIRKDILRPCKEELSSSFYRLNIEEKKRGRAVEVLNFTWKEKKKEKKKSVIEEAVIVENDLIRKKHSLGEMEYKELVAPVETDLDRKIHELSVDIGQIFSSKEAFELYSKLAEIKTIEEYEEFKKILRNRTANNMVGDTTTKVVYTEDDIDESLIVGKTGRKLVGAARKYKIEKILSEMNK